MFPLTVKRLGQDIQHLSRTQDSFKWNRIVKRKGLGFGTWSTTYKNVVYKKTGRGKCHKDVRRCTRLSNTRVENRISCTIRQISSQLRKYKINLSWTDVKERQEDVQGLNGEMTLTISWKPWA